MSVTKDLPTLDEFKKATYVTFGLRSHDKVITRLDELLTLYHKQKSEEFTATYLRTDLFFTADYWLKLASKKVKTVNAGRTKGMEALYRLVVEKLCENFNVEVNELPRELEMCFGRELSGHGEAVDYTYATKNGSVVYLKRAEASKYKLQFFHGFAYQWRKNLKTLGMWCKLKADTTNVKLLTPNFMKGYTGFAMSMSRDLYVSSRHTPGSGGDNEFFHSSYLSGGTVMCAGSIKIENGIVKGICNDSGHYQPTVNHLVNVLECLRMQGCNSKLIEVFDFSHNKIGSGIDVLNDKGLGKRLVNGKQDFKNHGLNRKDTLQDYKDKNHCSLGSKFHKKLF